ncbi:hypothetical protein UFOVP1131_35 [uncultured Caudovirales phage]|uniref:Uncharacterized protein n=1 Tax=uncultured Caudovirales phage TaxID=2100421 RepID=A0A6J5PRJ3_9CAUD|nr:hypothetical protein UFOVP966_49 [uncultured Caudovirales phage]CAB4184813.1 hypothetical protein UFOVP1131_35 [uncultured Caudovirales phage]CAB4192469.1 hypothetical protein UFOVP1245_27 [uncultured Caudovirales phage]CAB5231129.1 hypothetical protein UFOVP1582_27 [uncultured Caudovirales phage]
MAFDKSALKDYVDVAERIRAWYEAYPNGRIETRIIEHNEKRVVIEARAYRGAKGDSGPEDDLGFIDDRPAGTGHSAMQIPGATPYTRGSEIENCETSAVGRALVMAGLPSKRIASGDEIRAKGGDTVVKREVVKSKDEEILRAAAEVFEPTDELVDWREAINGSASITDLNTVAQQIASSKLGADAKKWLAVFYNARKADFA